MCGQYVRFATEVHGCIISRRNGLCVGKLYTGYVEGYIGFVNLLCLHRIGKSFDYFASMYIGDKHILYFLSYKDVKVYAQRMFIGLVMGRFRLSHSFAFLENKLTCAIDGEEIVVSMDKQFPLCSVYIGQIDTHISELDDYLEITQDYIDAGWNVHYRKGLRLSYRNQKTQFTTFRNHIVDAMNSYEDTIFAHIKPLVVSIVSRDRRRCSAVRSSLSDIHPREGYCWMGQDVLYSGIVASENLDELVGLLIQYIQERNVG